MINRCSELKDIFSWWLRNDVTTWSIFSFLKKFVARKYSLEFISTFWRNISLSFEELVPVMVSKLESSFSGRWSSFCYDVFFYLFFFHMSHNDEIIIIKHVFITVWSISSLGPFCWQVLSDIAVERAEITFISTHINANQNSYHDDKSIL